MTSIASCTPTKPVLVVNGVEDRVDLVLGTGDSLWYAQHVTARAQSMRVLPQMIQTCLQSMELELSDLSGIACVRGPGTFTGVRVTLALALGLARGQGIPLAGMNYLPLVAAGPGHLLQGEIWVCTYARKNLIYLQGFTVPGCQALTPAQAVSREHMVRVLQSRQGPGYVVGSGLRRDEDWLQAQLTRMPCLDSMWDHPGPEVLLRAAWQASYTQDPILPLYLRPSDAEMNLEAIAQGRGVDLERAREVIPDFETRTRPE